MTLNFIRNYTGQLPHLLVSYADPIDSDKKYVSIADDDTFPQHKLSLAPPILVKNLKHSTVIGSCHGLLCSYGDYQEGPISRTGKAVIWNPSIGKAVAVAVPDVTDGNHGIYQTVLGFGVCRRTSDPKILKITHVYREDGWVIRKASLSRMLRSLH